jgi:predicted ATPase
MGQTDEGLSILAEALAVVEHSEERWWEAELYRVKGELLLRQAVPDEQEAEACLRQAFDVAHLWQSQNKRQDAYDLLAPVYNWFTEGFDTADLKDAKGLLEE